MNTDSRNGYDFPDTDTECLREREKEPETESTNSPLMNN